MGLIKYFHIWNNSLSAFSFTKSVTRTYCLRSGLKKLFIILLEIRYVCYSRLSCSRGYNNVLFSCTSSYFSKSYFFLRYPTSLILEPFIKKQLPYHLSYHGTYQEGAQVSESQGYTGRL